MALRLAASRGRDGTDRDKRRLQQRLTDVSHRLRRHLDSEQVLLTAVDAVRTTVHPERTSIWLGTGQSEAPRLACTTDAGRANGHAMPAPPAVLDCLKTRRPMLRADGGGLAIPIVGPRGGLLGALQLEGADWTPDQHAFAVGLAREAAIALETASLYEQAVAEQQKSEAILARIGDAVYLTDSAGVVTTWNDSAARLCGLDAEDAVGHSCTALLGLHVGDDPVDCSGGCPLLGSLAATDGASGQEVWRERPDGRKQPLLATAKAVADVDGNVTEVVHSLRDITRLKEADEAKTLFLATASHELKTPLTVIQGFAQALLTDRDWSDEERREALEAVRTRAIQLNKIVDRILLSSRIETGRTQIAPAEIDLAPLVLERVDALRAATGRDVVARLDDDVPRALADADALTTVLDHLLDNAVKYSPEGGSITVTEDHDERALRLTVADEGIGMDAEEAAHCFHRFWQAESSDVRRFGGTGIGLYIVASLVEAMGGDVAVRSSRGEGSSFTITLMRPGVTDAARPPLVEVPPEPGVGDRSIVREFMRQIGVPERKEP